MSYQLSSALLPDFRNAARAVLVFVTALLPQLAMCSGDVLNLSGIPDSPATSLIGKAGDMATEIPLPLVGTNIVVNVSGAVIRTHVSQTFRNLSGHWLEGRYTWPLPEDAVVDHLQLAIGDRIVEGEFRERGEARLTYQQALARGQGTALVEQQRRNVFTTSVANIAPDAEVTVALEYQHLARFDQGRYSLRMPLVVAPRYQSGDAGSELASPPVVAAMPAQAAPQVVLMPAPAISYALHNPVSMTIYLDPGLPVTNVASRYHAVTIKETGRNARKVTLAADVVAADRDFVLDWQPVVGSVPAVTVVQEEIDGEHFALLTIIPPLNIEQQTLTPREVVFVLDRSGSMHGDSIRQAREAIVLALQRLRPGDRFNIVAFNDEARALYATAAPVNEGTLGHARQWVMGLSAEGGTEIVHALDLVLDNYADQSRMKQIVFMTDGAVDDEETLFRRIGTGLGQARLFTVGIGAAPNSYFMREAAALGRGTFTYVGDVAEVGTQMSRLFTKLETPLARDIRMNWPRGAQVVAYPEVLPDLYAGEPLTVLAKLEQPLGRVDVRGRYGDRVWSSNVVLPEHHRAHGVSDTGIARLWARAAINDLFAATRRDEKFVNTDAMPEVVRQEVVRLSLAYRVMTRFTAMVAVDKTPARPDAMAVASADIPPNLPAGWSNEAVFGQLAQTATPSWMQLLIGVSAMALAVVLAGWSRRRMGRVTSDAAEIV